MKSAFSQDGHGPVLSNHRRGPMATAGPTHVRRSFREGGPVRRSLGEGGFTMVELIAVIAIIALLAAAVTGGVVIATKKAAVNATKGLFQRLDIAIGTYYEDYGNYPPDRNPNTPNPGGWGNWCTNPGNDLNMPPETLWFFLAGMYERADIDTFREELARKTTYISFEERDLRRTGKAFWMNSSLQNINDPYGPDDDFPEIVDVWGNPIYYICRDEWNTADPKGNKDSYDLASRGPDRMTGNPYDERNVQVVVGTVTKYPNRDNITNFKMED